jgi:MarR family transcriptional regulator, organic hydroperoxide resistance regulator
MSLQQPSSASPPQQASTLHSQAEQVLETIVYLYTESRRITKDLARRAQLTGPQLTVLKGLEQIGSLSLTELSEHIRAQNSTVTGIIDRMERDDLVVRERSEADRRVVRIRLTKRGAQLARDIPVEPMEAFQGAIADLNATDMQDLLRILTKLAGSVRARLETSIQTKAATQVPSAAVRADLCDPQRK